MTTFAKVISANNHALTVQGSDGRTYTVTGDRNLRNNNPGNIEAGTYANGLGAIGSDGRFAVFPDYTTGQAAQADLQFNNPNYSGLTIQQAINKYAPPSENNSAGYAAGIAHALGVPVTTPLASLTAAQRQTYLQAQQNIEGGRAQVISDAAGNVLPPSNIPNVPTPTGPINASGAPDDRSATAYSPPNVTPIPLAPPLANVSGGPDDRNRLPFSYSTPSTPLKNVSGSPDDRDSGAPISAPAPSQQTVTTKNGTYVVGQSYQLADGASYRANADGSFTKTANTPRNPTPIQLAIESQAPGAQANLNNTISAAKGVASMGATAVSGLGSLFGNLFGGGSSPAPVAANSSGSPDDRNTSPVPSLPNPYKPSSGGPFSYPTAAPNSSGSPDDRDGSRQNTADGIAGTVQLPSGVRPSIPSTTPSGGGNSSSSSSQGGGYFTPPPANNDLPFSYAAPPSSYAPPAANSSGSPDDRGTTYTTQTVQVANPAYTAWMNNQSPISPFTNPGVQGLSPDDRDSPDGIARAVPGLNNPVFNMPAPPKTITKIVRVPVASRPQAPAAPVAAAPIAPVPIASTNGYTYLPNGSGGYTRVGQVNPSVTPAAQYAAAAAPALASQPSGGYAMANQPGGGSRNDTFNVD